MMTEGFKRDDHPGAAATSIGVLRPSGCITDDAQQQMCDSLQRRLAKQCRLVDIAPGEIHNIADIADIFGYLVFVPSGLSKQLNLDYLGEKPTVIVWRGIPLQTLPYRHNCVNLCLGDPSALTRVVRFFEQMLPQLTTRGSASKALKPQRETLSDPTSLAIDLRLFAFPELSERGIGHYVLPHLRAILCSDAPLVPTLLVDSPDYVPQIVTQLAEEYRCRILSVDAARAERFDIVHLPDPVTILPGYDSPLRIRPSGKVTSALFYDLIPLRARDHHFNQWDPRSQSVYLNRLHQVAAHDCHLFAISECTKTDLVELLAIPPDRITTILAGRNYTGERCPGTPSRDISSPQMTQHGSATPFFLIVGAIEKHKNFPLALEAFSLIRRSHPCRLVIVGSFSDPFKEAYREVCRQQGMNDVIFTGFLEKSALEQLYQTATAVLVPSLYEGFGFPALEAMEHGSPIIASSAASLPEVVGDGGLLLSPTDPKAWADAMIRLIEIPEERERYRTKGLARAQLFSWEKTAARVLSVWRAKLRESS